jgi:oxygen-independent coproporphyrinogen III oxidase
MAGIYIHIPFCTKACHYCNFHFSTNLKYKNDFINALLCEIKLQKKYVEHKAIETIYFGGGTPSLLDENELVKIVNEIKLHFDVNESIECTLEANPDDITEQKIAAWKRVGVNRLSIGIQSFFEEDLKFMNRSHTAEQAQQCVRIAQVGGIENISIDLIFGYPLLTNDKWKGNLQQAFALNVNHLSCYAMTVEPETALASMILKKKEQPINSEQSAQQFDYLMEQMSLNGYDHYEISNYAKPNFRAQHNTNYWKGVSYLGLGPSAHSFNGISRQWNVSNNALYCKSIEQNEVPFEVEILTPEEKFNEYVLVSLRLIDGISLKTAEVKYPKSDFAVWNKLIERIEQNELIEIVNDCVKLTNKGKLFADDIASDLFV